jgi:hypothetical protein
MTGRQSFELLVELSSSESSYPTLLSVGIQTLYRAFTRANAPQQRRELPRQAWAFLSQLFLSHYLSGEKRLADFAGIQATIR